MVTSLFNSAALFGFTGITSNSVTREHGLIKFKFLRNGNSRKHHHITGSDMRSMTEIYF